MNTQLDPQPTLNRVVNQRVSFMRLARGKFNTGIAVGCIITSALGLSGAFAHRYVFTPWFLLIIVQVNYLYYYRAFRLPGFPDTQFRAPRAPSLSNLLSQQGIIPIFLDGFWVFFTVAAIADVFPVIALWLWCIITIPLVPLCRFALARMTLSVLRGLATGQFSTLLCRPFRPDASNIFRTVIGPVCGSYGHLITILDNTLETAERLDTSDADDVLSQLSDQVRSSDSAWMSRIQKELPMIDLIVLYWSEVPSSNLQWEFKIVIKTGFSGRVVVVCPPAKSAEISKWLDKAGYGGCTVIIAADSRKGACNGMYRVMRSLTRGPRSPGYVEHSP